LVPSFFCVGSHVAEKTRTLPIRKVIMAEEGRVRADALKDFVTRSMICVHVPAKDAAAVADVLVTADLRGVDSHGVARLRRYVEGVVTGTMTARPNIQVVRETPCSALLDGDCGLGQVIGRRAMGVAIEKAQAAGIGVVSVRNSNHYGIAGYYSLMALEHDLIGCSMTNARARVVPTYARTGFYGTNPISVGIPAGEEWPFLLDMATSVVPEGKVEVYSRLEKPLPAGWVVERGNEPITDAADALELLRSNRLGGVLPLGGLGELLGGHKGYGLGLMVDILCGLLSGANYGPKINMKTSSNLGHFFAAMRVDLFQPLEEFKAEMDTMIRMLKATPKADGHDRIYVHGEKEFERYEERSRLGIPLHARVVADLQKLAEELGIGYDL